MRIVLTGGGTAGHVMPNVAVIEELRAQGFSDENILYVGSERGMERAMVEKTGVSFEAVPCGKLRRYFSMENLRDVARVFRGIWVARRVLRKFAPDVVFSKGGYVGVPVVIAAARLKIPVVVHESDLTSGLANRICFRYASKIAVSFADTLDGLGRWRGKGVVTGNPVRKQLFEGDAEVGRKFCGFDKHRPVVLVMGGSQGAEQINTLIRNSLDELLKKFQVVHLVGRGNLDIGVKRRGYAQFEFLGKELFDVYAMCDLVVTRGGVNSLLEVGMLKKKALVIPLSGPSRGDQVDNAQFFAKKMGWSVLEGKISEEDFLRSLLSVEKSQPPKSAINNGTKKVVDLILNSEKK